MKLKRKTRITLTMNSSELAILQGGLMKLLKEHEGRGTMNLADMNGKEFISVETALARQMLSQLFSC